MAAPTRFPTDMKPVEGLTLDRGMAEIPEHSPGPASSRMPRIVRKRRYEELFRGWFTLAFIDELVPQWKPPPEVQVWLERYLFEDGDRNWRGTGRAKFIIIKPPWYQRPTLMELTYSSKRGYHYKLVQIAHVEPERDDNDVYHLPGDLSSWTWGHLRGKIGEWRQFKPQDFIDLREIFDLRRGILELERRQDLSENEAIAEEERQMEDYEWDMLDYNFKRIQQAANHGRKSWSYEKEYTPFENLERYHIERHVTENGQAYRIRCKRGGRIERELIAAQQARFAEIEVDTKAAIAEVEARHEEEPLQELLQVPVTREDVA